MKIIGEGRDLRSGTQILYAQVSPDDYLSIVGEDYGGFAIQRKRETHKAYSRLKDDIRLGASLPTITLAIKPEFVAETQEMIKDFGRLATYLSCVGRCNILDGLQRTYILDDLRKENFTFIEGQEIFLEIWIESNIQKLVYRIIVLNAGQKPMSARHQIELLFASLHSAIEKEIGNVTLVTEKDQKRRRRPRIYPLQVVISGYQAFVSGATELNKDNLISQQLQVDSALDMDEESIRGQFSEFIEYFRLYAALDEEIFRIYSGLIDGDSESDDDKSNLRSPHWLTNENTCISFFASISQYSGSGSDSVVSEKVRRTKSALNNLIAKLSAAEAGSDPMALESLDAIRAGKNARKINVGTYTRRLLANGLKEYYRAEGDIRLIDAWNLAAD
ncbi:hypothetical protein [Novacetimonas hansenii]|uniref:hypothetical protein n=1 Tax=Novacetimonas hansenii TaxID=436 RepID=UPI0009D75402|nr:hypothetical protein [Novacetimonas hansenii]